MNVGPKRVTFAKYNLKKWHPSIEVEFEAQLIDLHAQLPGSLIDNLIHFDSSDSHL